MFYSVYVLTKKGFLAPIWTEGTTKNKLSKKQVISSNIKDMCMNVIHPKCGPLALRLSAILLLGITRIHNRQCKYLLSDTNDVFGRVFYQAHPQTLSIAEQNSIIQNERVSTTFDPHQIQETMLELNITASQMGLDPILDSLNLEDGQLIIGENNIDEVLQGMATPLSDIPMESDITLHRLTEEGSSLLTQKLEELEERQNITNMNEFLDPLPMDDLAPSDQPNVPLVLTPPKYEIHKRIRHTITPDSSIELNEHQWKRQRLDVSYMIEKRPSLPLYDYQADGFHIIPNTYQDDLVHFLQFHVNVHNSIQTASNSAASSIEKRRGRRSTVDDYNNFDVMDMDMGPFDERLTDVPVVDSSIALDSTSGLNLMRKTSSSNPSSSSSTPSHQNTIIILNLLFDAGLKEHPVSFNQFTQMKRRGFTAKSFYHLLVLATDNQILLNQQESYGDIEINDVALNDF